MLVEELIQSAVEHRIERQREQQRERRREQQPAGDGFGKAEAARPVAMSGICRDAARAQPQPVVHSEERGMARDHGIPSPRERAASG